jgi:hypothetical protein
MARKKAVQLVFRTLTNENGQALVKFCTATKVPVEYKTVGPDAIEVGVPNWNNIPKGVYLDPEDSLTNQFLN